MLTNKQKRFCDEYLIDCNATRAYKCAYPHIKNDNVASVNGSRMLTNAKVKKYIDEEMEKIKSEKIADATEVMEYLSSVMRGESQSEIVVVEGVGDGCSQAKRVNKLPDEKEKLRAAELLGKRYSLFTEKVDVKGDIDIQSMNNIQDLVEQMKEVSEDDVAS